MNFNSLVLRLQRSQEFLDFKQANPDSFLCAGFFIRDYKEENNQTSIDYSTGKDITSFTPNGEGFNINQEPILDPTQPLNKIDSEIKVDIDQLKELVEKALQENKVSNKLEKIIAVLQNHDHKTIWNLTCMCEGMKIILVHIDAQSGEILKFQNKSLFDFVRPMKK